MFCFFLEMLCFRIELIGAKRYRIFLNCPKFYEQHKNSHLASDNYIIFSSFFKIVLLISVPSYAILTSAVLLLESIPSPVQMITHLTKARLKNATVYICHRNHREHHIKNLGPP